MQRLFAGLHAFVLLSICSAISFGQSWIGSTSPAPNTQNANDSLGITVGFTRSIDPATLTDATVKINGSWSGMHRSSSIQYNEFTKRAVIQLSRHLLKGEAVSVVLTSGIRASSDGAHMPPYQFGFTVNSPGTASAYRDTSLIQTWSGSWSAAADMDGDGDIDIYSGMMGPSGLLVNDGHGVFSTTAVFPNHYGSKVGIQDLDGDGNLDIVSFDGLGEMAFLWNDGSLNFTESSYFIYPHDPDVQFMTTVGIADLNNDGLPDLIMPNGNPGPYGGSKTYILMNRGDRTWDFRLIDQAGGPPCVWATGDIDGDGDVDLVIGDRWAADYTYAILKNNGSGFFTRSALMTHSGEVQCMLLTDVDGNGTLDLLLSPKGRPYMPSPLVEVLKNDGNGNFTPYSSTGQDAFPVDLKAVDLDGDGLLELLVANSTRNSVSVLKNDGTGRYTEIRTIPENGSVSSVLANDFDQDGDVDVAALVADNAMLSIHWNRPSHVMPRSLNFGNLRRGETSTRKFTIYNDDPSRTVVVSSMISSDPDYSVVPSSASLLPGDSLGVNVTLSPSHSRRHEAYVELTFTSPEARATRVGLSAEYDAVVSVSPGANLPAVDTMAVLSATLSFPVQPGDLPSGAITIVGEKSGYIPVVMNPSSMADTILGFVPGKSFRPDENVSVTLANSVHNSAGDTLTRPYVWMFKTRSFQGTGQFKGPFASAFSSAWTVNFAVADFNGDGADDIVANCLPAALHVLMSNGRGGFTETSTIVPPYDPGAMAALDLDNDGDMDFVFICAPPGIWKAVNDGTGHFTISEAITSGQSTGSHISVGDVNGDGWTDLMTSYGWIYLNDHHGMFEWSPDYRPIGSTTAPMLGDIDGDGDLDVVGNDQSVPELLVWRNNGRGMYTGPDSIALGGIASSIALADLNGDGKLDIAAAVNAGKNLAVCINQGAGSFTMTPFGIAGTGTGMIAAKDVDSDGDLDILTSNSTKDSMYLFTNEHGDFSGTAKAFAGVSGGNTAFGDFNRDGSPEYAFMGKTSHTLQSVMNRTSLPDIAADTTTLNFGSVPTGKEDTLFLRISNEGTRDPLAFKLQALYGVAMHVAGDSLHLNAGDTMMVPVIFRPESGGSFQDSIIIYSNDPRMPRFTVSAKGTGIAPPPAPVLATPGNGAEQLRVPVVLTWASSVGAASYRLQLFQDSVNGRLIADQQGLTALQWTKTSLPHDSTFVWRVAAVNVAGQGPFSNPATFTTWRSGPAGLVATPADSQSITLRWRRPSGTALSKYYIYKMPPGFLQAPSDSTASADDTSYTLKGLQPGDLFVFCVASVDSLHRLSDTSSHCKGSVPLFLPLDIATSSLRGTNGHWGDFDNDGDLDLLVTGLDSTGSGATEVYRNDQIGFTLVHAIPSSALSAIAEWGDFDRDGFLDFFTTTGDSAAFFIDLWRNEPSPEGGRAFSHIDQRIPGSLPSWIDVDNDGDLDILMGDSRSALYRNNSGSAGPTDSLFTEVPGPGTFLAMKAVTDYDGDGRQDFASIGASGVRLFRNNSQGSFVLADVFASTVPAGGGTWGDFNNDGRPDFAWVGSGSWPSPVSIRYYVGSYFMTGSSPSSSTFNEGVLAAADVEGNGSLDLFVSGAIRPPQGYGTAPDSIMIVLRNNGSSYPQYAERFCGIPVSASTKTSFADMNNDGKLEAFAGPRWQSPGLYRIQSAHANNRPEPPSGLSAFFKGDTLVMRWKHSTDPEQSGTKAQGLTYNVFVDSLGGRTFLPANADRETGFRRLAAAGNASQDTCWLLATHVRPEGKVVWSVQAIDHGFAGSMFAPADTVTRGLVHAGEGSWETPLQFALGQNYPNPFNPKTVVGSQLPVASEVRIVIYDLLGREVKVLVNERRVAGYYQDSFDASGLASGVYVYRFTAGSFVQTRKMVLLK